MSSRILEATFQATALSALSNLLAQGLQVYRKQSLSSVDEVQFLHFVLFSLIATPPNYALQKSLESCFPTRTALPGSKSQAGIDYENKERLSIVNTAIKFVVDQTFGACVNTLLFIAVMGMFKGLASSDIVASVNQDFWPMLSAGYKFWPLVSLLNLVVVPFERRMLVGNIAAFGWGVYMSLCSL